MKLKSDFARSLNKVLEKTGSQTGLLKFVIDQRNKPTRPIKNNLQHKYQKMIFKALLNDFQ